ncbi:MAG: hypothetical protein FWD68_09815 [Alphaproteobacteria bacterium]|nr:hypothetical protein [Alphaproteobacteria bacterium]
MIFDPFGDFAEKGYLRNSKAEKNPTIVKKLEHYQFRRNAQKAISCLASCEKIEYADVLATHRILFGEFYPWAGQDRATTAPDLNIGPKPVTRICSRTRLR